MRVLLVATDLYKTRRRRGVEEKRHTLVVSWPFQSANHLEDTQNGVQARAAGDVRCPIGRFSRYLPNASTLFPRYQGWL